MHIQPTPDELEALTPLNPFGRFPDGRPCVPDQLLDRLVDATTEQAWKVLNDQDYRFQFEGGWRETHPGRVTIGRALTAQFLPFRPDFHAVVQQTGVAEGRATSGGQNSWVIESLQQRDVMVVDIFGKVKDGTVVGDNLGTAVKVRTRAGAVIDGGIRDYQGLVELDDVNFYFRGMDPSAIADVTLAGINIPVRVGHITVLPGDVILGTSTGVIAIPPHLAEAVAESAEATLVRDRFGKLRLAEGRYASSDIDVGVWREDIEADFVTWRRSLLSTDDRSGSMRDPR
jgi:4-hydroxy-4-methyl-2-oxoglutarate aldolase